MQKCKYGYKWPAREDSSQEPEEHIVQRLAKPNTTEKNNKTFFHFKFDN